MPPPFRIAPVTDFEIPSLADIQAAAERVRGFVRRTPMLAVGPSREPLACQVVLKLENLQITGSFKARGASNKLLTLSPAALARGLVTASGGNHGLAVAYAGWRAGVPTTVYLPSTAPRAKGEGIATWGARVVMAGEVWDDAAQAAIAHAEREGSAFVHPFADPAVIAGQGTVGLEILAELPPVDVIVVAIGGGGLASGVALAVRALRPAVRLIGVEPAGAPTLHASLQAGRVVELEEVRTAANTLAPRRSAEINFAILRAALERIVLVSDEAMREAARWLWREAAVAAELSGAAAVAALRAGEIGLRSGETVCAIVCGAGTDGL